MDYHIKMVENMKHHIYSVQKDVKDADAVAFAFINKDKVDFVPYKQPELQDDEIRANILYSGLCASDYHVGRCKYGFAPPYPLAPGHEIIGEVAEVGKNVTNFKKGEKVAFGTMRNCCETCKFCKLDKEPLCDSTNPHKLTFGLYWGGYSTQLQQPASHFFKIPEKLDITKAAPLLCAGITVYNPIKTHVKPGMKTAVIGVGGLGHLAVQFLAKMGHEVAAVTTSPQNVDLYKKLGATHVINSKDENDVLANAGKYDFVLNTIPNNSVVKGLFKLTAKAGIFCQVGLGGFEDDCQLNVFEVVAAERTFVGSAVGSRKVTVEMLEYCANNNIYPYIENFDFEDFPKALDKLENGKPQFRCVVDCGKYAKKHGLFK